ncbi:S41 family peptidase [Telmatobacter bradus]|uniref:S41 family peptidase n=1 Tax=Telmatobacter bradus TaxID=474953 RepID=UPI003B431170
MTPRARRAIFTVVFFFAVCALMGSVLQRRVGAQSAADQSQFNDNLKNFSDVYALVEKNYADPVNGDKADTAIYDGAIPGMLHVLDPHSNFYDPKAYAKLREEQRGHYYGVGMLIQQQRDPQGHDHVIVVTPYEGTPSFRAGLHPGDTFSTIDGKSADGWTSDQVAKALKGPKGTHVQVGVTRVGEEKLLSFDLIRDEIPHPSVDLKYEIRPGIGYVHLTQFQETSGQEMREAIDGFSNLKGLVIDLRGNPGGLLSQAVDICDHLLTKGQPIVSQRGRAYPDQNYVATHGNGGKSFPIVVLVNRSTASAAEIVSGALQDHDRALIVGETTFGKGLVQTVYDISDHSMGLALTTYHYYTPSGRLIQRNYTGVSLYDYYYNHAGAQPADNTNREVKLTDAGRTVYGGGGITPDEKIETPTANHFQDQLAYHDVFFKFAPLYLSKHTIDKNFQVDDAVLAEFKKFVIAQNVDWNDAEAKAVNDWLRVRIKDDIVSIPYGQQMGLRLMTDWDPSIQKAISFLPEAQALQENAHKVATEKAMALNGDSKK